MQVEYLIYAYGCICLAMIVFNCFCIWLFRHKCFHRHHKSEAYLKKIEKQLDLLKQNQELETSHLHFMRKQLKHVGKLMAFDETVEFLPLRDEEIMRLYLKKMRPIFIECALKYLHTENMQSAYFAYLMAKYKISQDYPIDSLKEILMEYLKKNSLYCRQNVMKSFYSFGNSQTILEALLIQKNNGLFFHSKILSDGLLTFAGDHDELIHLLLDHLNDFSVEVQVSILNYIRFQSGNYGERMLELLQDDSFNAELHFSILRYFGKYPTPLAQPYLIHYVKNPDVTQWNYAAISATSLASYPCDEVIATLKQGLHSSNWYVRNNSAQSLEKMGLEYNDLLDVFNGDDRYAREILMYYFEERSWKRGVKDGI